MGRPGSGRDLPDNHPNRETGVDIANRDVSELDFGVRNFNHILTRHTMQAPRKSASTILSVQQGEYNKAKRVARG